MLRQQCELRRCANLLIVNGSGRRPFYEGREMFLVGHGLLQYSMYFPGRTLATLCLLDRRGTQLEDWTSGAVPPR